MFAAISLLAITFAVVSAAGSADQCCLQRRVNSVDERGGVYSLDVNLTLIADISSSPVCSTNCIYTKVGKSGQIFCFGHGSLTSECSITPAGPKRPDFTTIMIGGSVGKTIGYPCNTSIKDFPERISGLSAVVFKNEIFVCGGENSNKCFVERNSSWIPTSSMIMPRSYHTMSAFKDSVVITGGSPDGVAPPNNEIEIFNGTTWTKLNKTLTSPRIHHCAVVISETEFYVLGGQSDKITTLSIMEKYNIDGNLVAGNLANMTIARSKFGCALLDGKIYAAGGGSDGTSMTTMEVYDPLKDTWTRVAGQLGIFGTLSNHLVMLNGKLVSYGQSVFSYDAEGENWTQIEEANKGGNAYFALVVVPCSED